MDDWGSKNRRLLNTEKIIFKAESSSPVSVECRSAIELNLSVACGILMAFLSSVRQQLYVIDLFQVYVLVTVEPEGVVAKPNVPERELALFNIGTVVVSLSLSLSLIHSGPPL